MLQEILQIFRNKRRPKWEGAAALEIGSPILMVQNLLVGGVSNSGVAPKVGEAGVALEVDEIAQLCTPLVTPLHK